MKKEKVTPGGLWQVLKDAFSGFGDDKVLTLSAALAYYTVFSMAPLLIVIIAMTSSVFDQAAVEGSIYIQLEGFMGKTTAMQLQDVIKNAALSGDNVWATIIGVAVLFMGATGVFAEIQEAVNTIWGIKSKPKQGWLKFIQNRVLSFSVIVSLGFLLLVSLLLSAVVDAIHQSLVQMYPDAAVWLLVIVNHVLSFVVAVGIFSVIFKVLPDAIIEWKDVIVGAIGTAVLFMLGKFAIGYYISATDVGSTFGAAGALVVLLVWTYYTAVILYFGAEFTSSFAIKFGSDIHPNSYAVTFRDVEVEMGKHILRDTETKVVVKSDDAGNIKPQA